MQTKKQIKASAFGLRGVGKQILKHLDKLDIRSIEDLLFHLPSRYQDRTQLQAIRILTPGEEVVVEGMITQVVAPTRGRTKLLCELRDETGVLQLRFFHVLSFQLDILKIGTRLRCYGIVRLGQKGLEIFHPEFQVMIEGKSFPIAQYLTPIYPATEGLSQHMLRKLCAQALEWMESQSLFEECLPSVLLQNLSFPSLKEALHFVHKPPNDVSVSHLLENKTQAQKRLVFEELLAHRMSLLQLKQTFQLQKGIVLKPHELIANFFKCIPFQLTQAQERVLHEIQMDLAKPHPMLRLLQGDVGSGKTVIAVLAMLQAVANGYQAVIMAPTELLAEQHYRTIQQWVRSLSLNVVFLSGHVKARARTVVLKAIANGEAQIIVGTHALYQEAVHFYKLALVIVDEQHRFGVQQRVWLREKGQHADYYPHQLMMTATPIPRTLAMSFYADLDCSIIDELPPGRTPVLTRIIASIRREEVMNRILKAVELGRQVYWVCPLIDESEVKSCQAATTTAEILQQALKEIKIGLIHGRMRAQDKEAVMRAFQAGEIQLLVATTVIEVGVDVPNASVMIIENAERLGLSQLHQLRGRVGRGTVESHCILLYESLSPMAKERLSVMRDTTDGFKIAQRDLELRGPGEVLGVRQTGELAFRVADLLRDGDMLAEVHQAALLMMQEYPHMIAPLIARWIGERGEYGKV